jgi:Protein of unknown function (DUF3604)
MQRKPYQSMITLMIVTMLSGIAAADDVNLPPKNPLRNAYFGDLHLHTGMSFDASLASGVNNGPETAYEYAKGKEVEVIGRKVKRHAALDFLAVTDHSEYLGVVNMALDPNGYFKDTDWPKRMSGTGWTGNDRGRVMGSAFSGRAEPIPEFLTKEVKAINWKRVVDAAEHAYEPGKFTSFVGYEWSNTPNGAHYHRVVIFPGPKYPEVPFSALDSRHPEDLWKFADANRAQGIDSILIPHNSNLSDGLMYQYTDSYGKDMDRQYAELRSRNELLAEITQVKGTSETHPELSPTDEFADFELMNHYVYNDPKKLLRPIHGSYIREGLQRGLEMQAKLGVNPFKLGLVGGSDFHLATSGTEEFNYSEALGADDIDHFETLLDTSKPGNNVLNGPVIKISASGVTGVWAERNTREDIFAAMKRREVFATSGPRMQVRLFASWNFEKGLSKKSDWVARAYATGVPMGADLVASNTSKSPHFIVHALKDPDSGNLDRIQIVKLWYVNGKSMEKVYDVVWSGNRKIGKDGKLPAIGNTVNVMNATYTNDIGSIQLISEWTDPNFDPKASAIYYARVLEIPTPRWTTYQSFRQHLPISKEVPATIQERAWTSPVFYTPVGK